MAQEKLTKAQLAKLLDEVTNDFGTLLTKAESEAPDPEMAKADPGEETPGEKTPASSSAEPADKKAPEASGDAPADPDAGKKEPDGDEAPVDGQAPDVATEQGEPEQTLESQYAALPVEELKLHFVACKTALMAALGAAGGAPEGSTLPAPPAPPAPAPEAPAAPAPQPQMGKKEFAAAEGSGGDIKVGGKMCKSEVETRLETLEKSVKEKDEYIKTIEEKFSAAAEGLTKLINSQPMRKSIAGVSFVTREEGVNSAQTAPVLSKAEAIAKCNEISARPDLKKSDRELLNKFVTGNCAQDQIQHLLTIK